ncbi:hypothetical protein ACEPPN_011648 [Leptodophora sp. 'Broadleaf-Isolate-01']
MARTNPPVGLEDPFTGPPAASSLPRPAPTHHAAPMNALGRTQSSRLNSSKTRKSTVVEGKMASTHPASRTTSPSDGLEGPFTGSPAVSMPSRRSSTHPVPQQTMGAFSQASAPRVNSSKIQQSNVEDNKAVHSFVQTASPAAGLDDPFTEPTAASTSSHQSTAHIVTQQGIITFNQVLASHLKQPKTGQSSGADSNDASAHLPQLSRFTMRSNLPVSSIISAMNRLDQQRSLPENLMDSRHLSIRSNVGQSSIPTSMSASAGLASQQAGQQSLITASQMVSSSSTSVLPQQVANPAPLDVSIRPAVQQQTTATINAAMATIARSSPLFVAPVPAVHQLPAQALPRPFLTTFASFPRLPTELQQEIWSVAIAVQYYMEKRFLRVAPDSESLERNDNDSEVAQIRIISDIHRRPRLVPSLLHACHYSRKEAIKGYELWGCADPVTYEANSAKVYVKVDIDSFFFGDADLGDFWALHTFINESEPDDATADDTARTKFIEQIGLIKHFTFDNELWNQLLEYEALWLANLDSCNQLTVAIRNPNHEQLDKDFALSFMKTIVPNTFREESARVILAVTRRALAASARDLRDLNWPENGNLELNVKSLAMGTSIGNTPEDETHLEDVLIEGNRAGIVTDQYLEARLAMMNHRAPPPAAPPAPAPAPAPAEAPVTAPVV